MDSIHLRLQKTSKVAVTGSINNILNMKYLDNIILSLHCFFIFIADENTKKKLSLDLYSFCEECKIPYKKDGKLNLKLLRSVLRNNYEFRNLFYWRIGSCTHKYHFSTILKIILPERIHFMFGVDSKNVGGGLFIRHGNSTIIHAKSIGSNFYIHQNVTIGDSGKGFPIIGNNVKVGTGAVVLGPITIGDNVIIGANATIVKSVPNNCTVVSSGAFVIKNNDKMINKQPL